MYKCVCTVGYKVETVKSKFIILTHNLIIVRYNIAVLRY